MWWYGNSGTLEHAPVLQGWSTQVQHMVGASAGMRDCGGVGGASLEDVWVKTCFFWQNKYWFPAFILASNKLLLTCHGWIPVSFFILYLYLTRQIIKNKFLLTVTAWQKTQASWGGEGEVRKDGLERHQHTNTAVQTYHKAATGTCRITYSYSAIQQARAKGSKSK